MTTPKKPLAVGDRVRVYGWVQMHHQPYKSRGGGKATVAWISGVSGDIHVVFDLAANGEKDGQKIQYQIQREQVRRLKPKRKAREFWSAVRRSDGLYCGIYMTEAQAKHNLDANWDVIHMREILPKKGRP